MKGDLALFSGRLGEIIEERTAGLAPGGPKWFDVVHRTIVEVLLTQPQVQLTGPLRFYAACALEQQWIPKSELKEIYRQRKLDHLEEWIPVAQWTRRTKAWEKAGEEKPEWSLLEAIAAAFGFSSADMLKQFRRRAKAARSSRRRYPPLPLWLMNLKPPRPLK
jgi:hypothetical protein